jgi:hypothetical protein
LFSVCIHHILISTLEEKVNGVSLAAISDKLFYISLIVVIVSVVISGVGPQGFFMQKSDKVPGAYEEPKKQTIVERQDKALNRLVKSKLLWIGIGGIVVSIVLSLL